MSPALRLAHALRLDPKLADLAREALAERDALVVRVAQLENQARQTPKFQGMTELA